MTSLVSADEVAERLGCDRDRVYLLAARGDLPSVRVGRSRKFDREQIEEFLRNGGTPTRSPAKAGAA